MLRNGHRLRIALSVPSSALSLPPSSVFTRLRAYSTEPAPCHNVAVLGGGITGLATAYYLVKELPRAKVTIYEASDRIGGWLSSKRVPVKDGTVLFEAGPRTLRPSSNGALSVRLMQELDIAKDAIYAQRTSPAARNRYVYYPDHLVRMPHPSFGLIENISSLLREPIFEGSVWGGLTEFFKDARESSVQDESVGSFFSRRIGKTVVDRIFSGIFHGIYAGDVWQLSVKSLFPTPWRDEAQAGSILGGMMKSRAEGLEVTAREAAYLQTMKEFQWDPLLKATLKDTVAFTFKDGLGTLNDGLARYLMGSGNVEFKTSTPVLSIKMAEDKGGIVITSAKSEEQETYGHVVSALSSEQLSFLHKDDSMKLIPSIPSVTVMTVNLYYRTPDMHPPGFGYVIPQATSFEKNPERALGVVFDTAYSPSPDDVDMNNWHIQNADQLKDARDSGQMVNVNDFAWYNLPNKPNLQDDVKQRGTKVTVMLGGHYWTGWPAFPDEKEGLALAKSLLERHLAIKEEPEVWQVNIQKDCIPQYTVGHEQRLKTAHTNLKRQYNGKLRVAGSWMAGVGVNDCLRSAWEVVQGISRGRDGTGLEHIGSNEYVRLKPIRPGTKKEDE
ncbi:oxygen-dependent protoporphyrinogen oxidase [Vermiconidia calcicola]|uniref:Oxygen-dependent protoporphyrinogen oxidase n=1 Tax=Vermiconidia calcicola TaxID=1690605 RepID=A0ACC3MG59_9PEZI|nr:oxygen-dependent protoporphyrinogen oxidase [Vermiconidia calcicola]